MRHVIAVVFELDMLEIVVILRALKKRAQVLVHEKAVLHCLTGQLRCESFQIIVSFVATQFKAFSASAAFSRSIPFNSTD